MRIRRKTMTKARMDAGNPIDSMYLAWNEPSAHSEAKGVVEMDAKLKMDRTDSDASVHPNSESAMRETTWNEINTMEIEAGDVTARNSRMWAADSSLGPLRSDSSLSSDEVLECGVLEDEEDAFLDMTNPRATARIKAMMSETMAARAKMDLA